MDLAGAIRDWHDFYVLAGTASATLVGLMFVAASIGTSFFTERDPTGLRAFITPTVLHFTAVLVVSLLTMVPTLTWHWLGGLLFACGIVGFLYSCRVWVHMRRGGFSARIDLEDRTWYVLLPIVNYLLKMAAGVELWRGTALGFYLLAGAIVMLMLMGIRNAWDMTAWIVLHSRPGASPEPGARDVSDEPPPP